MYYDILIFLVVLSRLRDFLPHQLRFNQTTNYDLKAEVEKILFNGDTMLPVSSDKGRFTVVMSTFNHYEKVVCIQFVSDRYLGPDVCQAFI